jgi:hypothetical protein
MPAACHWPSACMLPAPSTGAGVPSFVPSCPGCVLPHPHGATVALTMLALHTPDMRPPPRSDGSDTTNASATRREGNIYELWIPIADQGWVFMQYDYSASPNVIWRCCAPKSVPACYWPFSRRFIFLACYTGRFTNCAA